MPKDYRIEVVRRGRTSPALRAAAAAEVKAVRARIEAIGAERDAIMRAHPELSRLAAELRELYKRRDTLRSEAMSYRYHAYRDRGVFREIIAQGDTFAECEAKAKTKG